MAAIVMETFLSIGNTKVKIKPECVLKEYSPRFAKLSAIKTFFRKQSSVIADFSVLIP